jgi:hypothetical protein
MSGDARVGWQAALLALGLSAVGCTPGGQAPPTGPANQPPGASPQAPASLGDVKPDFVFDAPAWREEWKKDRAAARKKYTGKVVELTGEVIFVSVQFEGTAVSGLKSGPGGWVNLKGAQEGFPVMCITTDPQPWLTVAAGSRARIRGRAGKAEMIETELVDCVIVEAGPSPALTATVEQVTRDVAADREAAKKKYAGKYVHAAGEVTEVVKDKDGTVRLKLKGASGVDVEALLGAPAAHRAGDIAVGQKIKLFGEVTVPSDPKDGVSLGGCVVTRGPA